MKFATATLLTSLLSNYCLLFNNKVKGKSILGLGRTPAQTYRMHTQCDELNVYYRPSHTCAPGTTAA